MAKIIRDLWILTSTGVTLFSKVSDEERINPQLFGALMSALNTFAEKLSDGGISNFEMSNIRFVIVKRRDLLFVGSAPSKVKEKKVIDELKIISDKFFEVYTQEILSNWDNDISIFSDFGNHVEQSLNPTQKLREALW
jgi:hypothetical protein